MICDVSDPAYMSAGTHRVAVVDLNLPDLSGTQLLERIRIFDDQVRTAIRALLRHGGYKPSGRGKPCSPPSIG